MAKDNRKHDEARLAKNKKISETKRKTLKRRVGQVARTYNLKIQENRLNRLQQETLRLMFLEAKWLRNDCLAHGIDGYEAGSTVSVKLPDGTFEKRSIELLGSQIKQSVIDQLKTDRESLRKLKASYLKSGKRKKAEQVGELRFVSQVNSIHLKQFGTTFRLPGKHFKVAAVQLLPGKLHLIGGKQIPKDAEIACAKLVERADGYHLLVTCYLDKQSNNVQDAYVPNTFVGIDMGLKDSLTFSDGRKVNAYFYETERLKNLRRKLSRQEKGSKGYVQTKRKISRECERISNRKNDCANKICHDILENEFVFFQDENISGWKSRNGYIRGGRKVQASVLGRVKAKLKAHPRATMLPTYVATTQTCPVCHKKTKHHPKESMFVCAHCNFSFDRDVHGALNMIRLGIPYLPVDRRTTGVEEVSDFDNRGLMALSTKASSSEARKPHQLAVG